VIKKENVAPKGTPAFIKLIKSGMEEHEQKGVIAPNSDAKKLPQTPEAMIQDLILFSETKLRKKPIAEIITNKRTIIFTES